MDNPSKALFGNREKENLAISLSGAFVCLILLVLLATISLIVSKGIGYFVIQPVYLVEFENNQSTPPVFAQAPRNVDERFTSELIWMTRSTFHTESDTSAFQLNRNVATNLSTPKHLARLDLSDGTFLLGTPNSIEADGKSYEVNRFSEINDTLQQQINEANHLQKNILAPIHQELAEMMNDGVAIEAPAYQRVLQRYEAENEALQSVLAQIATFKLYVKDADQALLIVPFSEIQSLVYPNAATFWQKLQYTLKQFWLFISESPKQGNTAGGVFPALFGTVLMVLLMTIMVTPLGVLVAIYLAEYAPNNTIVSIIRVAVGNLAGVPSIVYGVFGLGFFVHIVGAGIDDVFYPERDSVATFGSPGLLWASLTMALLTLPVVIVATEEGIRRVPKMLKQGSYALGATKLETIIKTVLPIASPGIMTGVVLAIARGAGEVAPLLMLGAVKFAPVLPIDGEFPYIHLERQFMHLGVLIYDGAFHSEVVGRGTTLMFAACLLLLTVVLILNVIAVMIRNRLRNRYKNLVGYY